MQAAEYDFYIEQGSAFDESIVWNDAAGAAHNLTGYSAKLSLRKNKGDAAAILTFISPTASASQGQITIPYGAGANGTIRLQITCVIMRTFTAKRCFYDLQLCTSTTDPFTATDTFRLLEGQFILNETATKAT
jgi:hypothetical protein